MIKEDSTIGSTVKITLCVFLEKWGKKCCFVPIRKHANK